MQMRKKKKKSSVLYTIVMCFSSESEPASLNEILTVGTLFVRRTCRMVLFQCILSKSVKMI